jgi:hypothetical protein
MPGLANEESGAVSPFAVAVTIPNRHSGSIRADVCVTTRPSAYFFRSEQHGLRSPLLAFVIS